MTVTITNILPHKAGANNTTYMFRTTNKARAARNKQVLVATVAGALLCALVIMWLALGQDSDDLNDSVVY
jgi:hypothetical protein